MTIGDREISLGEFEYLYKKNNQVVSEEESSTEDYVDLFVNFKLKVIEAEALGYDTVPGFVKELAGYRDQLAEPYLKDQDLDEQLIREAYDRLKEEVEASHILIRVDANTNDTLKAYNKAMQAREEILAGADFATVAKKYSEDPSAAQNGGYLGYFTGFQMVLPFEEAAFNTPVGEISHPARSRFGYHIIKITNRRASSGEVNVSHILILSNDQMSEQEKAEKKEKAFEVYGKIQQGYEFSEMAQLYSEDHGSATKGGNIGFIRTGQTIPPFEKAAFALENKGDISEPVLTRFGWHIIRLEGKKGLPGYEDKYDDIKRRLARDERGTKPEKVFIANLKKEYSYTVNEENLQALYKAAKGQKMDSTLRAALSLMQDTIMTYGDAVSTQQDLIAFSHKKSPNGTNFESQFAAFEKQTLLDYEKSRLELKYDDFKYLMNEYHDGLLLFEISNEMVWGKASKDEKGLNKFYKKNKKNYTFNDTTFSGTLYLYKDSATLAAFNLLPDTLSFQEKMDSLNKDGVVVKTEEAYFKKGDNIYIDRLGFKKEIDASQQEFDEYSFRGDKFLPGDIKPLDATRGACISDYQNYLEARWIKSLRKKYKVKVNQDILSALEE